MAISCLITLLSAYLIASIAGSFLYVFPIAAALIILTVEVLSLFKQISPIGIILCNTIIFIAILTVWFKKGKPLLKPDFEKYRLTLRKILNSIKLDKTLIFLGAGFIFLIIGGFILCAFLPVNDYDALDYHTYRALVWAGHGQIFHFDTKDIRNLVMPINSEIIYTWIYSLTGRDIGFGFLEFFSFLFGVAGIWMFLEICKISIRKRLWAIFVFSSFAGIISQISSTQSDLFTGVLLLYSIIFFLDYIDKKDNAKGYFSSLCFAIALGVKSTAFMAGLPVLGLFLIYAFKKGEKREYLKFISLLTINFFIFSGYNYVLNFIDYSNPLGSEISLNRHAFFGGFGTFIANFIRYNIQMFDFAGFRWGIYLSPLMFEIQNALFSFLHIPNNAGVLMKMEGLNSSLSEQTIGFGITGFLVFIPCAILGTIRLIKSFYKKTKQHRIIIYTLGLLFYLNLIVLSFAIGYMVYSIRFITAFITISAPVLVLLYFKKNNLYKGIVTVFCLFYLFIASGFLAARPLYSLINVYKKEQNYDNFTYNVRCMEYGFFKGERAGCKIDETLFSYIEEYKTVGIFADENILMHLTKINAKKKHILIEELILSRFDNYDIKKYDYLITPYPSQPIDEFNNSDKKAYKLGNYPKDCYFRKNDTINKVVKIQCGIPYKKLENKGFAPIYNVRISQKDIENKDVYSQYIIWKNTKM